MNEKDRLKRVLNNEAIDRPPVICPGGMMSSGVTEVIHSISGNHNEDQKSMSTVARNINKDIGFENLGVPFCLTVEAEEMGAEVDFGSNTIEARVTKYSDKSIDESINILKNGDLLERRSKVVFDSIKDLENKKIPVIGNITGHFSIATQIYEPTDILKMFIKSPEKLKLYLNYINDYLKNYAKGMISAGCDCIAISDPTATGEILGGKNFSNTIVPIYKTLINYIHSEGIPVILHICGGADSIIDGMELTGADALSFDSCVSLKKVKTLTSKPVMGNVSTVILASGDEEKIAKVTDHTIDIGVDILAPACGLGMETKAKNLRTMVSRVSR